MIAFFHLIGRAVAGDQPLDLIEILVEIVGIGDVLERQLLQFLTFIAERAVKGSIGP